MSDARTDDEFRNPAWGLVRVFVWIAAGVVVAGAIPLVVAALRGAPAGEGGGETKGDYPESMIGLFIAIPIAVAMLISALASVFPARAADRALAAFRRGEWLVRWDLPPDRWAAHAEGERRRWRKTAAMSVGIVYGILALLGVFMGFAIPKQAADKLAVVGIVIAAMAALGWLTYAFVGLLVDRRADRLARSLPRAYVGATSVYCGGAFNFWGAQWRALHDCRVEPPDAPGEPSRLVFEVGMTQGARRATRTAGLAMALAGRSMGAAENNTQKLAVPIPAGQEEAACDLAGRLLAGQ